MPDAAKLDEEAEWTSFCVSAAAGPCTAEEDSFNACFERLLCLWIPKGIGLMNNIVAGAHDRGFSTEYGVSFCTASPLIASVVGPLLRDASCHRIKAQALERLKQMRLRAGLMDEMIQRAFRRFFGRGIIIAIGSQFVDAERR